MAGSYKPMPDRCGALRSDGMHCANRPALPPQLRGNGKCAWHGGYDALSVWMESQGQGPYNHAQAKRTHTGFYSRMLRNSLRTAEEQAVFDDPSAIKIDLKPEIALWRSKLMGWQEKLKAGEVLFESAKGQPVMLEDVIDRGARLLTRLLELQAKLHPNEAASGELTINVKVSGSTKGAGNAVDMPDLEAGHAEGEGRATQTQDAEPVKSDANPRHELEELDSD